MMPDTETDERITTTEDLSVYTDRELLEEAVRATRRLDAIMDGLANNPMLKAFLH